MPCVLRASTCTRVATLLRSLPPAIRAQFTLAAHVVSQLHAVDGGATYGLPYDRLLPPLREQGETALSCTMLLAATYWWIRAYRCHYNPLPVHVLSPRGVFELCLRKAEVAADCWRRRNGLPAATEAVAAGGSVGASGSGGRSSGAAAPTAADGSAGVRGSGGRQVAGAGNGAGPAGAADAAEAEQRDGQAPPNAILDPRRCPLLALGALGLSRRLATGSVRPGQSGGGSDSEEEEADEDEDGGGSSSSSYTTCSYSSAFMDNGGEGKGGGVDDDVVAGEDRDSRSGGGGSDGDGDGDGNSGNRAAAGGGRGVAVKGRLAWVCDGGPLARRWWRAAVAAVHCGLDNMALDDVLGTSEGAGLVLDLKPVLLRMNKMLGEGRNAVSAGVLGRSPSYSSALKGQVQPVRRLSLPTAQSARYATPTFYRGGYVVFSMVLTVSCLRVTIRKASWAYPPPQPSPILSHSAVPQTRCCPPPLPRPSPPPWTPATCPAWSAHCAAASAPATRPPKQWKSRKTCWACRASDGTSCWHLARRRQQQRLWLRQSR